MHLVEDHAKAAGIPLRFAASKLVEGDPLVFDALRLSQNEQEMLEHIISQMGGGARAGPSCGHCRYALLLSAETL